MHKERLKNYLLIFIFLVTLAGISLDIYNRAIDRGLIFAFSAFKFFTIQSNLLLLFYSATELFLKKTPKTKLHNFILGPITAYILLTGIVYLIILEPIYELYGLERLSSVLLHYVSPVLMFTFWIVAEKRRYRFAEAFKWLIYPIVFMIWGLFLALLFNDYLYPFFDISLYGVYVGFYIVLVAMGFAAMIVMLIFINNFYLTNVKTTRQKITIFRRN